MDGVYLSVTHLLMLWTRFGFLDLFDHVPGEPMVDPAVMYAAGPTSHGLRFASLA